MNNAPLMVFALNLLKETFHLPHFPNKEGFFFFFNGVFGKFSAGESAFCRIGGRGSKKGAGAVCWPLGFCRELFLGSITD